MWYKKYGWEENPFKTTPGHNIVALDKEKEVLIECINSNQIAFITGETGTGKTSLLLWLNRTNKQNKQTNKTKTIMVNGVKTDTNKQLLEQLKKNRTFTDKILRRQHPKNMVILMDEADQFSQEVVEYARILWDEKKAISLILASTEKTPKNITTAFNDRITQRIEMPKLGRGDMVELIKQRTENKNPFDLDAMISIVENSGGTPRRTLENCMRICKWCVENNIKKIDNSTMEMCIKKSVLIFKKIRTTEQTREQTEQKKEQTTEQVEQKPEQKQGGVLRKKLSEMQQRILGTMMKGATTNPEIADLLGVNKDVIRIQLKRMIRKGAVCIVGEGKTKRYILTKKVMEEKAAVVKVSSKEIEDRILKYLQEKNAISGKVAVEKECIIKDVSAALTCSAKDVEDSLTTLTTIGKIANMENKIFIVII